MANIYSNRKLFKDTGWQDRHDSAVSHPRMDRDQFEWPISTLLKAWAEYAKAHYARFGSKIGDDYVLGPEWQQIGEGIRGLLDGELGRLDGGTCDAFILDTMSENGIDTSLL